MQDTYIFIHATSHIFYTRTASFVQGKQLLCSCIYINTHIKLFQFFFQIQNTRLEQSLSFHRIIRYNVYI